ncbi:MAG: hypothetical protein A3F72_19920 [Bacteroidetes bacterium RIFCSPLOWO2_12_FULL_35_15]|nr:MAG: hypothetical protein A3F72_19920 [Bacteroidetes bacterium RIFCSPLOWO2_12_FULL_35_15]
MFHLFKEFEAFQQGKPSTSSPTQAFANIGTLLSSQTKTIASPTPICPAPASASLQVPIMLSESIPSSSSSVTGKITPPFPWAMSYDKVELLYL